MTAEEVEELWTSLFERAEQGRRIKESCVTSDRQGIRMLAAKDFDENFYKELYFSEARHYLVEILARSRKS
jgi:hypothetical protein